MLNPDTAARIKACKGVYSIRDTARHFNVSPGTVHNVWHGHTHTGVLEASETPYVNSARKSASAIREDAEWLLSNGESLDAVAARIGVSANRIKREVAPALLVCL